MMLGRDGCWGAPSYVIKASQKSHHQERPLNTDHGLRNTDAWEKQLSEMWKLANGVFYNKKAISFWRGWVWR